ncbi:MAG TPA: class I SAM-dependent methyltransferase [Burkholderiales bacterium]|jgi:SAM-dependent methyltransferase
MQARTGAEVLEANRSFYEPLWSDCRLVMPERFNTWPLVQSLLHPGQRRLEVAPGLRPRLPLDGTRFVEMSPAAVAKLQAHGAHARTGLVSDLPFTDAAFDLVCALDIIEHVADDESALSELARVAAPGAVLLLSAPMHQAHWSAFDELVGHFRRYEPQALLGLLADHGITVEQSAVYGMCPKPSPLLDFGMWALTHRRRKAMWFYNHLFMPLGIHFQKKLAFAPGMAQLEGVDELLLVCRKG